MIRTSRGAVKLPLLAALVLATVLAVQGSKGYELLADKTQAQAAVTESVLRWKQSYLALADAVVRWGKQYRREDSVQDLVSLYAAVNVEQYGLQLDKDALTLNKVEPEIRNGVPIGLTRICLTSSGGDGAGGLEVRAPNYQTLFAGVKALAARRDISIDTISVRGVKAQPVAYLGEFCVLMRKS